MPDEIDLYEIHAARRPSSDRPSNSASSTSPLLPPPTSSLLDQAEARLRYWRQRRPAFGWQLAQLVEEQVDVHGAAALRGRAAFLSGLAAHGLAEPHKIRETSRRAAAAFRARGDTAWLPACTWLAHAQPWLDGDFPQVFEALKTAREGLLRENFQRFVADCDLALAGVSLLLQRPDDAAQHLEWCREPLQQRSAEDEAEWLIQSLVLPLRRQDRDHCQRILDRLDVLLAYGDATILKGKLAYRRAFVFFLLDDDLERASQALSDAYSIFQQANLTVWQAQVQQAQAQLDILKNNFSRAGQHLLAARAIFNAHRVPGLLANNAHDLSWLSFSINAFKEGAAYAREAIAQYRLLGVPAWGAGAEINLASCLVRQGDYQAALQLYEEALVKYRKNYSPFQRMQVLDLIFNLWLQLGDTREAALILEEMERLDLGSSSRYLVNRLLCTARLRLREGKTDDLMALLSELDRVLPLPDFQFASGERLLDMADLALSAGNPDRASTFINTAEAIFQELEASIEQADCARLRARANFMGREYPAAGESCRRALELNGQIRPEFIAEVKGLQGMIAHASGAADEALTFLDDALSVLAQIQRRIWQPELLNGFLERNREMIALTLRLTAERQQPELAWQVMQLARAGSSILQPRLQAGIFADPAPELSTLQAEIDHLTEQTRGITNRLTLHRLNQQRMKKARQLGREVARYERRSAPQADVDWISWEGADLQRFLSGVIARRWCALTYQELADSLLLHIMTPTTAQVSEIPLTPRLRLALERLTKSGSPQTATFNEDCAVAGQALFPANIWHHFDPEQFILLAPTGNLLYLPWNSLLVSPETRLVSTAIPCLIPNWGDLPAIWSREQHANLTGGLVLAVETFGGRHAALPGVREEIRRLNEIWGEQLATWQGRQATWEHVCREKFPPAAFIHFATHAFYDEVSGFLSGLAFGDQDVWHHALLQLAPLPPLVTFTACSSLRGHVLAGAAQRSLATTCLAGGARSVVGSLWPLRDQDAAALAADFYTDWQREKSAALALASCLRRRFARNDLSGAGYLCVGVP